MHEAAEVWQKMKEHEYKIKIVKTLISSYYSVNLCSRENNWKSYLSHVILQNVVQSLLTEQSN